MTENEEKPKPKRGGSKPILKVSGIGRVDNNMKNTLFSAPAPINQKNYYTDYLKKDDQIMFYRQWNEEQRRQKELKEREKEKEKGGDEEDSVQEVQGSKTIVIHPGSVNLRLGLATHVYPKRVPNVIAHRGAESDVDPMEGINEEAYQTVQRDFKERMRFYKRRILPNSHEMVANFNARTVPENIPDHNDPYRVEWTGVEEDKRSYYTGDAAIKIPPGSGYVLRWPIRNGRFNEDDYKTQQQLLGDISLILVDALERELDINFKQYREHNVVLLIPDLYDRAYVVSMVQLLLDMGFGNVCILQESIAATFGAGISVGCIVDVGAQKTSISCVEEGMIIPDSRVHLDYGGDDITRAFIKLLLRSSFPYKAINLAYQHDWTLAEDLKTKFVTVNDADIAVQLYSFYQRAPNEQTKKYEFKTFDEVMLAPLGLFYPELFGMQAKNRNRYRLFPPSMDIYEDNKPNEPVSDAQINIHKGTLAVNGKSYLQDSTATSTATTNAQPPQASSASTPGSSLPGTPAPPDAANANGASTNNAAAIAKNHELQQQKAAQELLETPSDSALVGLEHAIIESVTQGAAKSQTNATQQNFYDTLMVVGGGAAKIPAINNLLSDRIIMWRNAGDVSTGEVSIMPIPREMDPSLITWKGGGVFAKLKIVNEVWISQSDWDMLGSRALHYKALFLF